MKRQGPIHRAAAQAALDQAWADYQRTLAGLRAIVQCTSWWTDGETRCDLLADHVDAYCYGRCGSTGIMCRAGQQCCPGCTHQHRHKPKGLAVGVIRW